MNFLIQVEIKLLMIIMQIHKMIFNPCKRWLLMARTANCLETATDLPIALETAIIILSTFN